MPRLGAIGSGTGKVPRRGLAMGGPIILRGAVSWQAVGGGTLPGGVGWPETAVAMAWR